MLLKSISVLSLLLISASAWSATPTTTQAKPKTKSPVKAATKAPVKGAVKPVTATAQVKPPVKAPAASGLSFSDRVASYERKEEAFFKICGNSMDEIYPMTRVTDVKSIEASEHKNSKKAQSIHCTKEGIRIANELKALRNEAEKILPKGQTCKSCVDKALTANVAPVVDLQSDVDGVLAKAPACRKEEEIKADQCAKSFLTGKLSVDFVSKMLTDVKGGKNSKGGSSDCLTEMVYGLIEGGKFAWNEITDMAKSAKESLTQKKTYTDAASWVVKSSQAGASWAMQKFNSAIEDQSSRNALLASKTSKTQLAAHKAKTKAKTPAQQASAFHEYLKPIVAGLSQMVYDGVKNTFACAKWSGTPHRSTCLEPLSDWACATCQQKLNGFCGALTFMGFQVVGIEVLSGYIIGAGGTFLQMTPKIKSAMAAYKAMASSAKYAVKTRAAVTGAKIATLTYRTQEAAAVAAKALAASKRGRALLSLASTAGTAATKSAKVTASAAKITFVGAKKGASLVGDFVLGTDDFADGYKLGASHANDLAGTVSKMGRKVANFEVNEAGELAQINPSNNPYLADLDDPAENLRVYGDDADIKQVETNLELEGVSIERKLVSDGHEVSITKPKDCK